MCHKTRIVAVLTIAIVLPFLIGCGGVFKESGFLSDYSRLTEDGGDLRYMNTKAAAKYSKLIIDPVQVYLYDSSKKKDIGAVTLRRLANTMQNALITQLQGNYQIVSQPGPGIARLRVAVTDIKKNTVVLNVIPQTRMTGIGMGGASMEAELVDSQTKQQLAAVIQTDKQSPLSLEGLNDWGSAEAVKEKWAKDLKKRLDKAHGK